MTSVASTITAKLQQDPASTTSPRCTRDRHGRPQAKESTGSTATIVTFDTNAELVGAIKDKKIAWTVDQQPFLQGYLAVDSLWLYLNNRNTIGGGTAHSDRAGVHRRIEHRRDRGVRETRHSMTLPPTR